jgi:hypothetical protein
LLVVAVEVPLVKVVEAVLEVTVHQLLVKLREAELLRRARLRYYLASSTRLPLVLEVLGVARMGQ